MRIILFCITFAVEKDFKKRVIYYDSTTMEQDMKFSGTLLKGVGDHTREQLPPLPQVLQRNQGVLYTASLYFPDILPKSASRALRKEIATYPALRQALEATNWSPQKRYLTPLQQQIIVHYLGEPV
ncbi:hypothetical protein IX332_000449 [Porphyromonas levii]|nr:hypothetical protein [Porphyromonas levii]MBR8712981.1 hypothetical protein [Porphyromonas levii]MBR8715028.1 hypothetical protein [Porphyromonas levii]MBR8727513.1 hypothetical protein [Porphyromonas levii]MBR8729139.1 hypothetical protein [Porphyromonas levii]